MRRKPKPPELPYPPLKLGARERETRSLYAAVLKLRAKGAVVRRVSDQSHLVDGAQLSTHELFAVARKLPTL